jgi:heat shock protein HtpX
MANTLYGEIAGNKFKTFIIFIIFLLIFTGFWGVLGTYYDDPWQFALYGLIFSFFSIFISYLFSDKLVLSSLQAKPARKEDFFDFYTVTENLCLASGLPMPKIYIINDTSPNAFATGRNPKNAVICATTGLLTLLKRAELEGVVAHELSHIRNYDTLLMSVVAMLVGSVNFISTALLRRRLTIGRKNSSGPSPFTFLFLFISISAAPFILFLIQMSISRQREYLADASAALLTRYPEGLADALEKLNLNNKGLRVASTSTSHLFIINPFADSGFQGHLSHLFSTHPSIENRIQVLRSL